MEYIKCSYEEQIRELRHKHHLTSIRNLFSWLLLSSRMSSAGITA